MTLEEFIRKLRTVDFQEAANQFGDRYRKAFRKHLKNKPYPPELPNQRYVRTGLLGSSYRTRKLSESSFRVWNSTPYAVWVIGKRIFEAPSQAAIHRGRWFTIQDEQVKFFDEEGQKLAIKVFASYFRKEFK